MLYHTAMKQTMNGVLLAFVAYLVTIGVDVSQGDVMTAIHNPSGVDWGAVGQAVVETGLRLRADVTAVIEGPVQDLVFGARDTMIAHKDEFAMVIPEQLGMR